MELDYIPTGKYFSVMNTDTRKNIMAEALRLFSEKGYDSVGTNEIVHQCGVSKPALYYYFESKEKLLQSIVQEKCLALKTLISSRSQSINSFEDMLMSAADAYLKFTSENKEFMRLYFSLVFTPHSNKAYSIVRQEAEAIQTIFEDLFNNDNHFQSDKSFIAVSFIGLLNTFSTLILNHYLSYSEHVSKKMLELFLYGAKGAEK